MKIPVGRQTDILASSPALTSGGQRTTFSSCILHAKSPTPTQARIVHHTRSSERWALFEPRRGFNRRKACANFLFFHPPGILSSCLPSPPPSFPSFPPPHNTYLPPSAGLFFRACLDRFSKKVWTKRLLQRPANAIGLARTDMSNLVPLGFRFK